MRRAKMLGRWAGKAPLGYVNLTTSDGKKCIEPKMPDVDLKDKEIEENAA